MNCDEVREKLSDYLEKSLDAETAPSLESHLSSCARCRAEARDFAESIRLMSTLPSIDPPGDFTQTVMARVREAKRLPNLWEFLFFPLTIKVPVHAITLVLFAVFAAYLYRSERPAKPEQPAIRGTLQLEDEKDQVATGQRKSLPSLAPQKKDNAAGEIAPPGAAPAPPAELHEAAPETFALRAPAARSALEESSASYELVLRLRASPDEEPALKDQLDSLRKRAQSGIPARRSEPKSLDRNLFRGAPAKRRTILIDIPPNEYDRFKKELSSLGTIESESGPGAGGKAAQTETAGRLRIKLTLLPAVRPEGAPPLQHRDR